MSPDEARTLFLDQLGPNDTLARYGEKAAVAAIFAATARPETSQYADCVQRDDIRRSIIRQLGDDPYADRIILNGTDWDIVLEALNNRTEALA